MLTVVKVGGGLARAAGDDALRALCARLGEMGARHRLLIVPGGAGFADAVRDHDRRFALQPTTSHRMGVLAMEQFGWLLGDLIARAQRCADLARAREVAAGQPAVLLPAGLELGALPASWEVTSDSIAAWVAGQVGAGRLVLVKEVDGLFAEWPARGEPLARLTVPELATMTAAGRAGGVDGHLATVLEGARVETWVVGGREHERVVELLEHGATVGTRIAPSRLVRCSHG